MIIYNLKLLLTLSGILRKFLQSPLRVFTHFQKVNYSSLETEIQE